MSQQTQEQEIHKAHDNDVVEETNRQSMDNRNEIFNCDENNIIQKKESNESFDNYSNYIGERVYKFIMHFYDGKFIDKISASLSHRCKINKTPFVVNIIFFITLVSLVVSLLPFANIVKIIVSIVAMLINIFGIIVQSKISNRPELFVTTVIFIVLVPIVWVLAFSAMSISCSWWETTSTMAMLAGLVVSAIAIVEYADNDKAKSDVTNTNERDEN